MYKNKRKGEERDKKKGRREEREKKGVEEELQKKTKKGLSLNGGSICDMASRTNALCTSISFSTIRYRVHCRAYPT